jgi:hypothetical protein
VPVGGNSEAGTVSATVIGGGFAGSPGPAGILSFVTIGSNPANVNAIAGQVASFSVGLTPDVPGCYQWMRDGVDIPGAVGPNYRLTTSLADDNTHYSVKVSLMGGTVRTSAEALLRVSNDVTGPTVTGASLNGAGEVVVTFSEPVGANANTAGNYLVDGVTPASATASGNTVTLVLGSPLAFCPVSHSVRVSAVTDLFGNAVNPNPSTVNFELYSFSLTPISANKAWRYDESNTELGDAWYATGFDDSTWPNGPGVLAFPAGEVISAPYVVRTALTGVWRSTYFRTHFNLPTDPATVTNLQLQVILDDGGVFYLNGQELTRIRMNPGVPTVDTLTSAGSPSDPPQILETYNVPTTLLVAGDNVIAARVHQSATTSSDTVFACNVVAQVNACGAPRPRLSITRSGNQVIVTSTGAGTIYKNSNLNNAAGWQAVGAAPQTVTVGAGSLFFEIRP